MRSAAPRFPVGAPRRTSAIAAAIFLLCAACSPADAQSSAVSTAIPSSSSVYSNATYIAYNLTLRRLEALLDEAHADMTLRLTNAYGAGDCTLSRMCGPDAVPIPASYAVDFSRPVPAAYDFVHTKAFENDDGTTPSAGNSAPLSTETRTELCEIDALRTVWRDVLARAGGSVFFQYFAAATNNFGLYPPLPWNCSVPYVPTQRPYYVAAATGAKNYILVIDVSTLADGDAERLEMAKAAAKRLVATTSYGDFVNIVTYATTATKVFGQGMRMTIDNVATVLAAIDEHVVLRAGEGSNIAIALQAAGEVKAALEADTRGSGCGTIVLLLSSGNNDIVTRVPEQVSDEHSLLIFSHYLVPPSLNATRADDTRLRRLACRTNGLFAMSHNASEAAENILNVLDFIQEIAPNPVTRWSEVYTDAFGQGRIVTAARPVYVNGTLRGMVALDVPFANVSLGGTLTEDELMGLQRGSLTCTPLDVMGVSKNVVDGIHTRLGGMCDDVEPVEPGTLTVVELKPTLAVSSALVAVFILAIPLAIQACSPNETRTAFKLAIAAYVVLWAVALSLFWGFSFDDIVEYKTFDRIVFTVDDTTSAPYRCCERTVCVCTDVLAPECPLLIANLSEGPCNNGFRCCRNDCRPCFCSNNSEGVRTCSECCGCSQAVLNEQCQIACGTCHSVSADVSFVYRGERVSSKFVQMCGRGDTECPAEFLAQYSVGATHVGFVNPKDQNDIRRDVGFDEGAVIACVVCASLTIVPWAILLYLACFGTVEEEEIKRRREYEVPESKVTIEVGDSAVMSPTAEGGAKTS